MDGQPTEIAPAADTWPGWARRQLRRALRLAWRHRLKLAALLVSALLARFCGVLAEPIASLCRALVAITDTLVGG